MSVGELDIIQVRCWLLDETIYAFKISRDGKPRHGKWVPKSRTRFVPTRDWGRQGVLHLPVWLARKLELA